MRARNALSESPSILGCSGRRTSTRMYSQLGRAIHVALSPRQPDRVAGPARWDLPVWRPSCPEASGAAKSGVTRGRSARTGTFRRGSCHLLVVVPEEDGFVLPVVPGVQLTRCP